MSSHITTHVVDLTIERDGMDLPIRVTADLIPGSRGMCEAVTGFKLEPDTPDEFEILTVIATADLWEYDENDKPVTLLYRKGATVELTDMEVDIVDEALFKSLEP
jgi:hypothetical protein